MQSLYVLRHPGGDRRVHLAAWRRQRYDSRDDFFRLKFHRGAFGFSPPPDHLDLRHACSPVEDQGELGSCTAHAVVAALEFNENRATFRMPLSQRELAVDGVKFADVSRLFQYLATRVIQNNVGYDEGATLRNAVKAARRFGAVAESRWPYDPARFAERPPNEVWAEAQRHRVTSYHSIADGDLESVKASILRGDLVLAGIEVTAEILSAEVAATGIVPTPSRLAYGDERFIGGHAVAIVGYDDRAERFAFRNSWGEGWGDGGYGYLGYGYLGDPRYAGDFWVVSSAFVPEGS